MVSASYGGGDAMQSELDGATGGTRRAAQQLQHAVAVRVRGACTGFNRPPVNLPWRSANSAPEGATWQPPSSAAAMHLIRWPAFQTTGVPQCTLVSLLWSVVCAAHTVHGGLVHFARLSLVQRQPLQHAARLRMPVMLPRRGPSSIAPYYLPGSHPRRQHPVHRGPVHPVNILSTSCQHPVHRGLRLRLVGGGAKEEGVGGEGTSTKHFTPVLSCCLRTHPPTAPTAPPTHPPLLSHRTLCCSGTSMATPLTAGAIALLRAVKPAATVAEIKNAVINSANPLAALRWVRSPATLPAAASPLRFAHVACSMTCSSCHPGRRRPPTPTPFSRHDRPCSGKVVANGRLNVARAMAYLLGKALPNPTTRTCKQGRRGTLSRRVWCGQVRNTCWLGR